MWTRPSLLVLAATVAALLTPIGAAASSPNLTLAVQGQLATQAGTPVADGKYALGLTIHDASSAGTLLFDEKFLGIEVKGGLFALSLGATTTKLPETVFDGSIRWMGLSVGGDPELPRVPMLDVPGAIRARVAQKALGLECTACVLGSAIANGAVGSDQLAAASVGTQHVAFTYAGASSKGGPATSALLADMATKALNAEQATDATHAASADLATSAKAVDCTGCITAGMLAASVPAELDLALKSSLKPVATSGKYSDLEGGPDLSPFAKLSDANTWAATQTMSGGCALGADAQFNAHQALLFRFQNADKDPVTCEGNAVGMVYYNTSNNRMIVCNGKAWTVFAKASALGSQDAPAASCKAVLDTDAASADGLYWLQTDPGKSAFQAYCDMQNGGWTLVMKTSDKSAYTWGHAAWTNTDDASGAVPQPTDNADKVSRAFYSLIGSQTKICLNRYDDGVRACETLSVPANTARGLANGATQPSSQGTTGLLSATWKGVVQGGKWGANLWQRWGWSHPNGGCGTARVGFTADNDSSDSTDSGIGLGLGGNMGCTNQMSYGSGYYHYSGWSPQPSPLAAGLQGQIWVK